MAVWFGKKTRITTLLPIDDPRRIAHPTCVAKKVIQILAEEGRALTLDQLQMNDPAIRKAAELCILEGKVGGISKLLNPDKVAKAIVEIFKDDPNKLVLALQNVGRNIGVRMPPNVQTLIEKAFFETALQYMTTLRLSGVISSTFAETLSRRYGITVPTELISE